MKTEYAEIVQSSGILRYSNDLKLFKVHTDTITHIYTHTQTYTHTYIFTHAC